MKKVMLGLVMAMMVMSLVGCGEINDKNSIVNTEVVEIENGNTERNELPNRVVLVENYEIVVTEDFEGKMVEAPACVKRIISKKGTADGCGYLEIEVDLTSINEGHAVYGFKLTELPEGISEIQGAQFRAVVGLEPNDLVLIELVFN